MKPIGVDPGFGNFKAAAVTEQGVQVAVVPSVVGVGETDLGLLSLGDLGGKRRGPVPDRVEFGGVAYLVGDGVARYARPVQRMDLHRLTDGPELRALLYATLHRLGLQEAISLIVGLPVEVMADRERALEVVAGMRRWMVGEHRFAVNGQEVVLTVEAVRAMAQPAGAFFAWGLDNRGRWARARGDLQAPVAVCDVGFNTLDLFAVQGGEVVGRFTGGDTAGVRRAAERLIQSVQARYGVSLTLQEADGYLRMPEAPLYAAGGRVDIRALVQQALDIAAAEIVSFVEARWGNGRQFGYVLFTGGGAEMMREALLRQYPHGVILPDPVTANAVGLARYAVRAFK
ncbi:MAG: hypothetical protein ACK4WK_03445 [Anaerolineae bacterium]